MKWMVLVGALTAPVVGCSYGMKSMNSISSMHGLNSHDYSFFILDGSSSGDPVTDERLAAGVRSTLMSKGWVEVPEGAAQVAVVIHTATIALHTDVPEDYEPGTMVVTIFDADTKQVIWHGSATDAGSAVGKIPASLLR